MSSQTRCHLCGDARKVHSFMCYSAVIEAYQVPPFDDVIEENLYQLLVPFPRELMGCMVQTDVKVVEVGSFPHRFDPTVLG
jgi:hypothetical protein